MQIGASSARVVLWALALLCGSAQGRAENAPETPTQVAQDPEGLERALRQGIDAYDRGDLAEARRAFELVHARAPTARTLRSLGLVAFREQRHEEAVALLEASLASRVKPLTASQREGAEAVLREARAKTAKVPEGTAISPPVAVAPAPEEVPAAPVQPPGPRVQEPPPPLAEPPALHRHDARGVRLKRTGYALLAVAGAAAIASVVSFQVARARLHKIEDDCRERPDGCELKYVRRRERSANLEGLGTASLATGISAGVLGASGTAILLWRWRSERNAPAQAELGLGWRGVF
jgi:hypothetical protein